MGKSCRGLLCRGRAGEQITMGGLTLEGIQVLWKGMGVISSTSTAHPEG